MDPILQMQMEVERVLRDVKKVPLAYMPTMTDIAIALDRCGSVPYAVEFLYQKYQLWADVIVAQPTHKQSQLNKLVGNFQVEEFQRLEEKYRKDLQVLKEQQKALKEILSQEALKQSYDLEVQEQWEKEVRPKPKDSKPKNKDLPSRKFSFDDEEQDDTGTGNREK